MNRKKHIRGIIKYLLVAVLSICVLYWGLGAPSFTAEMALHRAERGELVGPSRLIASAAVEYVSTDRILLGETDKGYTLLEYTERFGWDDGRISYYEKNGSLTCFTTSDYYDPDWETVFPVYAVPENGKAATARLTMETTSTTWDDFNLMLTAEAALREDAFFLFEVDTTGVFNQIMYFWRNRLQGELSTHGYASGTLTVELFDRSGALIETVVYEFPAYL